MDKIITHFLVVLAILAALGAAVVTTRAITEGFETVSTELDPDSAACATKRWRTHGYRSEVGTVGTWEVATFHHRLTCTGSHTVKRGPWHPYQPGAGA